MQNLDARSPGEVASTVTGVFLELGRGVRVAPMVNASDKLEGEDQKGREDSG